jgi:ABC-type anion transport system duplicated permease subunit
VAEYIDLGDLKIDLGGIGSLITRSALEGETAFLITYVAYLTITIITINKLVMTRILFKSLGKRYYEIGE